MWNVTITFSWLRWQIWYVATCWSWHSLHLMCATEATNITWKWVCIFLQSRWLLKKCAQLFWGEHRPTVRSTPRLVVFIVRWLSVSQSFLTLRLKDLHETLFNILFIGIRCEYVHVYSVTVQAVLHWCMARARYCTSIFPHDAWRFHWYHCVLQ